MQVAAPKINDLASAYGVSRQALYLLRTRHALTIESLTDPDEVFGRLIESGRDGKLRKSLSDFTTRAAIRATIDAL